LTRTEFLMARLDEQTERARRTLVTAAEHLVLLEAVRHAIEEAQVTLDEWPDASEAVWLADAVLGAFVVAWQEHEAFQPGWMSD